MTSRWHRARTLPQSSASSTVQAASRGVGDPVGGVVGEQQGAQVRAQVGPPVQTLVDLTSQYCQWRCPDRGEVVGDGLVRRGRWRDDEVRAAAAVLQRQDRVQVG